MGFIYQVENIINHKKYIGQTTLKNPHKRFVQHLCCARHNEKKYHYRIYEAIRKHGEQNFSFSIIEEVSNEKLDEREKYWIAYYDTYRKGYNMTYGGKAMIKHKYCKVSDEEILDCYFNEAKENGALTAKLLDIGEDTVYRRLKEYHIKTRNKYQIAADNNKANYKPIWQVDINTLEIVKEWKNIASADIQCDALEARKTKISRGYFWCYANKESYERLMVRVKDVDCSRNLQYEYVIQQLDPDTGEVLNTFKTIREATAYVNKTRVDPISNACNGRQRIAYGFMWRKVLKDQALLQPQPPL